MSKCLVFAAIMLICAGAEAAVFAAVGHQSAAYFQTPSVQTDPMVSFDWGSDGNLYFSTGSADWGPKMNVWRYDGAASTNIFSNGDVYAGSWLTANGQYVYFNEDMYYNVYRYDTSAGGGAENALQHTNMWGFFFHDDGVFISGADDNWESHVYYAAVDQLTGTISAPQDIGAVGDPSGPIAFDAVGNLYFASGYAAGRILKYTAGEVAEAVGGVSLLADPAAHAWADFSGTGLDGATGMAFDSSGALVATLTSFAHPSQLMRFDVDAGGACEGMTLMATSDNRMYAVRLSQGALYVNDPDGIYTVSAIPEPATLGMLAAGAIALLRRRRP
ncbi:MAG: PEP-CTERM sorting domain-containing protein [Planctomycetes bacterium]|nr:PEP-CTERM sorting domain-containing protein [Planctomycetota bacterium]